MKFKSIAAAVTLFFYSYSIMLPAWADTVTNSAAEGNAAAAEALRNFSTPSVSDGSIIFGGAGEQQNISLNELFPGIGAGESKEDLENLYGDDHETLSVGGAANTRLKTEESADGDAYRVLLGTARMTRPNIKNDPLWTNTDSVMNNQSTFEKDFADCKETNTVTPKTTSKHIPDYKTCERVNKPAGSCDIVHDVEIEPLPTDLFFLVDNSGSMEGIIASLRENVYRVAELLGVKNEGQLRIGGAVTRNGQWLGNHIKLTEGVAGFQGWINSVGISSGGTSNFEAFNWAVANNYWRDGVKKVVVVIGNNDSGGSGKAQVLSSIAAMGIDVFIFHDNADIKSIGTPISNTFTAGGLLKVAQFLTVVKDSWGPADCVQAAKSTKDGFCTGSYSVTSGGSSCVNFSGFDVCPGDPIYAKLTEPPIPDVPKTAVKVSVGQVSCPFNEGAMDCYVDGNGVEQCPTNSDKVCAVNHTVNLREIPLTVKVAVEDMIEAHETHQVVVDFVEGTVKRTNLQGFNIVGSVTKADYNYLCGPGPNGKPTPTKFVLSDVSVWQDQPYAPKTLPLASVSIPQSPNCENGLKAIINITDHAVGELTWYFAHVLKFKGVQLLNESWGPDNCIEAANRIAKGQCPTGNIRVTKGVASGCLTLSGVDVCPGDPFYNAMMPSPIQGIDKLALQVRAEGCIENGLRSSTCGDFEKNNSCGFISQKCVGGAEGASGYCYVQEEVWDCGYNVEVPSAEIETSYQCDGPVRCLGTECYNPVDEKSSDFAYAAASLQIAMFAEHDLDCGEEGSGDANCRIWKGEAMECKKAVGGWVDCCEAPDGVSLMDYVNLTMNTLQLMEKAGVIDNASIIDGAWTYGKEMIASAWNSVFASATDAAAAELTKEAAQTWGLAAMKQAIMNAAAEWTAKTFGAAAANTIFAAGTLEGGATGAEYATTNAATGTTGTASSATFAPMLGAALSVIMWAYMIYQIANILVQIIWECEEEEFMLGAKKETKVCHFVGSYCASKSPFGCIEKREAYCCFNSPLGRIIQEQARPQLGQEWGEAENPQCEGLRIEDLPKIDWSKIDISEWVGLLEVTGHYPTVEGMDLDKLTGEGSALNVKGGRADTLERNIGRLDGLDFGDARKEAEDSIRATVGQ
ncbi:TPA: conjugal transfer protein TraN [Pseudomonas aeruginosa]|uniref:Uncharacterized protein n=1 Tax=Pseudomonas aeruginosa TaxID=287 RepID=A0A241XSF4_PSEAI|nr:MULTISPECIES: conjugal transfer protein TraN [Pseudomonas]MBI8857432.1 conjugal transfer protein TraN [Pseudomonas aeruginosa]OBY60338.1 hypothetical protein A9513_000490 [Pseudomonas sp. AU12215]OTI63350.1 hypothetical protein CAZ10_11025 [Pseudomonas aeruginosa]HDU2624863.1 conjugal transfer protein TraN [Pseudomonas aeruginosa]